MATDNTVITVLLVVTGILGNNYYDGLSQRIQTRLYKHNNQEPGCEWLLVKRARKHKIFSGGF